MTLEAITLKTINLIVEIRLPFNNSKRLVRIFITAKSAQVNVLPVAGRLC